jgi:hypothetical protein
MKMRLCENKKGKSIGLDSPSGVTDYNGVSQKFSPSDSCTLLVSPVCQDWIFDHTGNILLDFRKARQFLKF